MPTAWLILGTIGGVSGLWLTLRRRDAPLFERVAAMILPPVLVALLYVYVETTLLNSRWVWSACRLAPTVAWVHGYPLYSPIDSGPINGWLYGPVAAIAWLPATLARSPQPALLIAATINLAFLLLPLLAAARRIRSGSEILGGLGFATAAATLLLLYPTWYMASALNVDAVAVGLGSTSCLLLLNENPSRRRLIIAALAATLAAWSKQVEAPLAFAEILWLWVARGRQPALIFALAYIGTMSVVTGAVLALMGGDAVIFNMWTIPAHHPIPGGWPAAWSELVYFFRSTFLLWTPCVALMVFRMRRRSSGIPAMAALIVAALALLPTGIMAATKLGGDQNSMHSVYYLATAALIALGEEWPLHLPATHNFRAALFGALAILTTSLAVREILSYPDRTILPYRCLSEEAFSFAGTHPDHVYFPWDPLATLFASGKMYHFEYGILDRDYAGRSPSVERVLPDLPAKLDLVVYPRADYPQTMLRHYLKDFHFDRATSEWMLFRPQRDPKR